MADQRSLTQLLEDVLNAPNRVDIVESPIKTQIGNSRLNLTSVLNLARLNKTEKSNQSTAPSHPLKHNGNNG